MSAAPIGVPGWPDLAFSTASAERNLMVFTHCCSRSTVVAGMAPSDWTRRAGSADVPRHRRRHGVSYLAVPPHHSKDGETDEHDSPDLVPPLPRRADPRR